MVFWYFVQAGKCTTLRVNTIHKSIWLYYKNNPRSHKGSICINRSRDFILNDKNNCDAFELSKIPLREMANICTVGKSGGVNIVDGYD